MRISDWSSDVCSSDLDAFVILDEAQNTTPAQMKMFLTRFGQNSRMVICGDPRQVDLPGGVAASGLADATARLEGIESIAMVRFTAADEIGRASCRERVCQYV